MRSGLASWCKECQLQRTREWRAANPDYEKEYNDRRRAEYKAKRRHNYPASRRSSSKPEAAYRLV